MISGQKFDRYIIEGELGRGGMGRVYRARDVRYGAPVALKVLTLEKSATPAARAQAHARFSREARAASLFEHPNAIAIYDVGEYDGTAFIAMELVEGESLRTLIDGGDLPSWTERLRWLSDAARALSASHEAGLVHRDVKPANVMVAADGTVKVLDFGIARRAWAAGATGSLRGNTAMKTLTPKGQLIGTPQYMAPEYILGEMLDARADQFAWGVLAHELLVGELPWAGSDNIALMAGILKQDVAPLRDQEPSLPPALDDAVRRCLSKAPADRFATMADLLVELDQILEQAPAEPPPAAATGRSARPRGMRRILAVIAAAAAVAVVYYAAEGPKPPPPPQQAPPALSP
jgi:eukaryotic-like serine/threonine-protein kinase